MAKQLLKDASISLASPRGFCAGVVRAIDIVERALELYGAPVYVLHEIVHNQRVLEELREKGAIFVESLTEIPQGAKTIFSAHGVSSAKFTEADKLDLQVIDATCPLVTKVHVQAKNYSRNGYKLIIIGHPGHPEVEGTRGRVDTPVFVVANPQEVEKLTLKADEKIAYVTQTTLSLDDAREIVEALRQKFRNIQGPDTKNICYATQNRQTAVRNMAHKMDVILVVGARNSSNSNRLKEVGEQNGCRSYQIQDATEVNLDWFKAGDRIGITAGASTPESLVLEICDKLKSAGIDQLMELAGTVETVAFKLPQEVL